MKVVVSSVRIRIIKTSKNVPINSPTQYPNKGNKFAFFARITTSQSNINLLNRVPKVDPRICPTT